MNYNWYRTYDPTLGRYNQADPLGFADGPNIYSYAHQSPLMVTDRDGRCPWCAIAAGAVIGAGIEAAIQYWECGRIHDWPRVLGMGALGGALGGAGKILGGLIGGGGAAGALGGEGGAGLAGGAGIAGGEGGLAGGGGTTVLGHYPEYKDLAETTGARFFNIPLTSWKKMSDVERWAANQKFLDRMIARGDKIIIATPIDKVRLGSYFAKELEYLSTKGYSLSGDGFTLIRK